MVTPTHENDLLITTHLPAKTILILPKKTKEP